MQFHREPRGVERNLKCFCHSGVKAKRCPNLLAQRARDAAEEADRRQQIARRAERNLELLEMRGGIENAPRPTRESRPLQRVALLAAALTPPR